MSLHDSHFRTGPWCQLDPAATQDDDPPMQERIKRLEDHAVETRERLIRIETTLEHVATTSALAAQSARMEGMGCELRQEMAGIKSELRQEMAGMKSELRQEMAEMKSELRQEMAEMKSDLRQEMGGMKSDLVTAMGEMQVGLIKHMEGIRSDLMRWFITVALALAALAFTAARFIH
ncbi:CCDC90 family protein [Luteibacter aegosomaticola]|uniref:CCDC90 family protein n=1 Tax=Luteibacter aegosomaticola TaxID=2911538 RepID=UPI001FF776C6|nr:CCDC90 family protein [Luteibacter aegosomaticola]UPG88859.1 CCDC90 family protein [Luteibacter aegosomaticola]